jgi:hypothetical protein
MDQLLFFYPSLLIYGEIWQVYYSERRNCEFRFCGLTTLFTLLGVLPFFQAKGYYAIGLYPVLLAFEQSGYQNFWLIKSLSIALLPSHLLLVLPLTFPLPSCFPLIHPFYSPEEVMRNPPDYGKLGLKSLEDGSIRFPRTLPTCWAGVN